MGKLLSLAIIPDGNRRFAKKNGISLEAAYARGFRKVTDILDWVRPTSVESTTLWALSLENFRKRSSVEIRLLFSLMQKELDQTMARMPERFPQVRFIGRTELLPKGVRQRMQKLEKQTENNDKRLNIAVAYSGRDELVQAATRAAEAKEKGEIGRIDERAIERYLFQPEPVDLLIRTGDVQRTSGFLPWQNAYAEVYFSRKLWPEFSQGEFNKALAFYDDTERRFGK